MKHKGSVRLMALLMAALSMLCLLPAFAAAEGTPKIDNPSVSYLPAENELLGSNYLVAGKEATLYLPVINRGDGTASGLSCELPYSGDPLAFPFESATQASVTAQPYMKYDPSGNEGKGALVEWNDNTLLPGERGWFKLSGVKALASLAQGTLQLVFYVNYAELPAGAAAPMLKLAVYVTNSGWNPGGGGTSYKSKPKVIIESYSFDRERIYAGDTVRVNLCVRNTSLTEAITNLQLDYADEGGKILPSSGSSNSVFLGEIKRGEACNLVLFLNVAPDAEAKTYSLGIKLVYEGTKNRAEFTEETSIALAVLQRIRVRLTEPAIYGDAWVGQSLSMSLSMYNLSKASIYNCSVELLGDGLRLEEPFFGGNIAAGGTMRADLSVISDIGGEVNGQLLITYEDVYGTPTTETVDFSLLVNEMMPMDGSLPMESMPEETAPAAAGFAWYWWLVIAALGIAGVVALILVLRKRRKKYLEEL